MSVMRSASGETKLFLLLGAIVLLGGGFLLWSGRPPQPPTIPVKDPNADKPKAVDAAVFDDMIKDARHVKGTENAPITIVEFADFECPSCRRTFARLDETLNKSPKTRFIFRHRPLDMHESARPAAIAAEAAGRQGKFWEMYHELFQGEETLLTPEYVEEAARKIGLDMKRFEHDRKDGATERAVRTDELLADKHSIDTTPTVLVRDKDGKILRASGSTEILKLMQEIGVMPGADSGTPASSAANAPAPVSGPKPG